jgi:hypothetical protein
MSCSCRTVLGSTYRDDCPEHSALPPEVRCARCPQLIARREPRIIVAGRAVHPTCADVRERLGLDTVTTPIARAEEGRRGRRPVDPGPVHQSPSLIRRLRRR